MGQRQFVRCGLSLAVILFSGKNERSTALDRANRLLGKPMGAKPGLIPANGKLQAHPRILIGFVDLVAWGLRPSCLESPEIRV